MTETPAAGSRGGRRDQSTDTLDQITAIYQTTRDDEFGDVCHWMVHTAVTKGEYHADHAADWQLTNRNLIGIALRHLVRNGLLEQTNEHRPASAMASHHRRSYVYRPTDLARAALAGWPKPSKRPSKITANAWPAEEPAQATLDIAGAIA